MAIASLLMTFSTGWPSSSFLIGSSCFLPDSVRGISATWKISFGTNGAATAPASIALLILALHRSVERCALAQHHEQRHVAFAAEVFEVDDQAVEHLGQRLDRAVQLARAHAQAVPVDGRVAAAVDDAAAVRRDLEPVAVPPDRPAAVANAGYMSK